MTAQDAQDRFDKASRDLKYNTDMDKGLNGAHYEARYAAAYDQLVSMGLAPKIKHKYRGVIGSNRGSK